jgi:2,3-bisphosphoglycerate-dependent phosphoglycerate mutase
MIELITNLYFVRHAHSTYTPGELERPLSNQGANDAKVVTELLTKENIEFVCSGPYKRAYQTVEGIAKHIGIEIEIVDDLKERKLSQSPVEDFTYAITKVWENENFAFDGGESNIIAQKRGVNVTLQILEKYKGKNIAVGTHGNIMVLIMNYFDRKFDFHFWKELEMPDIYKLSFQENSLINVCRVWKDNYIK